MKIGEQTLYDGTKVEIHRCEVCGEIHVAEVTAFGPLVLCPKMGRNSIRFCVSSMNPKTCCVSQKVVL